MSAAARGGATASRRISVLERIVSETRDELQRRKRTVPLSVLEARIVPPARTSALHASSSQAPQRPLTAQERGPFHQAVARPGMGVIAEFKRRSPSAGVLRESPAVTEIVSAYERGGASALSVLTEGPNFEGSLEDLRTARAACKLPILRKDFIVDRYQLYEAVAAGADAVLLIVAALGEHELGELHALARELGLDVLVEVHGRDELLRALSVGARLVGINNRDLRDFSVDVQRTSLLMPEVPDGVTVVSESGIARHEQLGELERNGVAAVLVGETLMRSTDPEHALRKLLAR